MSVRAVLFDAGHPLLAMDYAAVAERLRARGHDVADAAVVSAERRARIRLDGEQAAAPTRGRTGEGRYGRYLLDYLGIGDDDERRHFAEWRRGYNAAVGFWCRACGGAVEALG